MTRQQSNLLKHSAILIAMALPFVLPKSASAETLVFVNDTNQTVVVQVAAVVRGKVVRGILAPSRPARKSRSPWWATKW